MTNTTPQREPGLAAIYARVSTEQQATGDRTSLERQEKNCRRTAARLGLTVHERYVVKEAHSASDPEDRPGLEHLQRAAERGEFQYVLVDVIDRATRAGGEDILDIIKRFLAFGVEPVWANHPEWDMHDILDRRKAVDDAWKAWEDKQTIARRFYEGKLERMENGLLLRNNIAYGYRWNAPDPRWRGEYDEDPRTMWEPDEGDGSQYNTAQVVRRIFRMMAEGSSTVRVKDQLNMEGVPPPSQVKNRKRRPSRLIGTTVGWNVATVSKITKDTSYKGQHPQHRWYEKVHDPKVRKAKGLKTDRYNAERDPSEWKYVAVPALVDGATWEAANRQLQQNITQWHRAPRRYTAADVLLYGGWVRCAYCGGALQAWQRGYDTVPSGRSWHYICSRNHSIAGARCQGVWILAREVDAFVWREAVHVIRDPDYLRSRLEHTDEVWAPETQIHHYQQLIAECDAEAQGIVAEALHWQGNPAFTILRQRAQEEALRIATARQGYVEKLTAAEAEQARRDNRTQRLHDIIELNATRAAGLDDLTPEQRRQILLDLRPEVRIARGNDPRYQRIAVTFNLTREAAERADWKGAPDWW